MSDYGSAEEIKRKISDKAHNKKYSIHFQRFLYAATDSLCIFAFFRLRHSTIRMRLLGPYWAGPGPHVNGPGPAQNCGRENGQARPGRAGPWNFGCQDTSDPGHFGPKTFQHYQTGAEVSGQFGTSAELSFGHFGTFHLAVC